MYFTLFRLRQMNISNIGCVCVPINYLKQVCTVTFVMNDLDIYSKKESIPMLYWNLECFR